MKKNILFLMLIILYVSTAFGQDKNQAINDYLQTIVPDYNEKIIIKKEKISPNAVLELFYGRPYKDSIGNLQRYGGAPNSLYNEKAWEKMKKEYFDEKNTDKKYFTENVFWNLNDFKYKNILFVPNKDFLDLIISRSEKQPLPRIKVFSFSDPIYYSLKYLIFAISKGYSESTMNFENYVVIMKKEKDKWIMVAKVDSDGLE